MKLRISSLCLVLCLGVPAGISVTGCAGDRYQRSTGEYIDDKAISRRVKSALNDNAEYKFSDVHVDSFKGTVQLSGFVTTGDQKRKAGDIAERVDGVKKVENNITIKP